MFACKCVKDLPCLGTALVSELTPAFSRADLFPRLLSSQLGFGVHSHLEVSLADDEASVNTAMVGFSGSFDSDAFFGPSRKYDTFFKATTIPRCI